MREISDSPLRATVASGVWRCAWQDHSPPLNPGVRKFVEIAEPNFGSFFAADGSLLIAATVQSSEMIPGSAFLWNLATWNQWGDDLRGVDALAVIGDAGTFLLGESATATDGVVTVTSASLGFAENPSRTIVLPYCHIGPDSGLAYSLIPCSSTYGIAEAPDTINIVVSFLADTTAWQSIGQRSRTGTLKLKRTRSSRDKFVVIDGVRGIAAL